MDNPAAARRGPPNDDGLRGDGRAIRGLQKIDRPNPPKASVVLACIDLRRKVEVRVLHVRRIRRNPCVAVSYQLEIDPRSPQIAGVMRDAYIALHVIPTQEIRLGQQKTPWGYENLVSSLKMYVVTRTEIGEGVGRGFTLRDIGIGLRGKIPLVPG